MAVSIVTDTASSISDTDRERLGLGIVPLHVTAEGAPVPEAELLDPAFYARLEKLDALPTTSQPSPEEFVTVFRRVLEKGHDILAVLISGGLSSTVESAVLAADMLRKEHADARIDIVDSRSNSMEEGFAVLSAAEAAASGGTLDECRHAAEETMRRTRFLFTPHTLEYLRRGGRITGASGLVSMMLKIAPILTAEHGETGIAGVARSGRAARAKVASLMRRDVESHGLLRAVVQYVADHEGAARFATEIVEPIVGAAVPIVPIHPVVGIHVGPAVGVAYETVEPLR
jgi:DegV family protein with EDD domain